MTKSEKRKEYMRLYKKEYRKKNKEKIYLYNKQYVENHKENVKKYLSEYSKRKPEKHRAISAKRKAAKLQQTPKWADLKAIEEFYKNCPKGYQVDHIIPLQGKNVRGLHVLENLQYLTKTENLKKGNRYA